MSDLIRREALLIEVAKIKASHIIKSYIVELITNAPAVSGEVVGWAHKEDKLRHMSLETKEYQVANGVMGRDLWAKEFSEPIYNTPQQTKSVSDALEEAANICDDLHYNWRVGEESGPNDCAKAIRALIKRNAVKEG